MKMTLECDARDTLRAVSVVSAFLMQYADDGRHKTFRRAVLYRGEDGSKSAVWGDRKHVRVRVEAPGQENVA